MSTAEHVTPFLHAIDPKAFNLYALSVLEIQRTAKVTDWSKHKLIDNYRRSKTVAKIIAQRRQPWKK